MFVPSASSGSATTYISDYWNFSASNPCLYVGGGYYQYLDLGMFYVGCYGTSSS